MQCRRDADRVNAGRLPALARAAMGAGVQMGSVLTLMADRWRRGGCIVFQFAAVEDACECGPDPGAVRADDGWRCTSCGRLLV